jgi:lipopolysaccharide/colanic/teichoic acid biosynthesis glycosyltransferase
LSISHPRPSQTGADLSREEGDHTFFYKAHFHHLLRIERHRTERSKKPFLLLLLDISALTAERLPEGFLDKLHSALKFALRETDIRGWYDPDRVIGVILTEMVSVDRPAIEGVFSKIHLSLGEKLNKELLDKIAVSFHVFPEQQGDASLEGQFTAKLYPDLPKRDPGFRLSLAAKRVMDVALSAAALLLLFPVFLAIAAAIKWTSDGPAFFRQERLGCNGKSFTFLKFRSMYKDNDPAKHRDYILKYISEQQNAAVEPGVFKLKDDLRITPVGRWLRKTSLDELPQLINVLKGEMSLVGPRPPILYECDLYETWHRRRLLSCKPGITGLWQVMGRSRTTFDDMVRLDLKYINEWSLGLDLKILLKTPGAVFGGKGAY